MSGISRRFWVLSFIIVAINLIGLWLIRAEIMSRPVPGLRVLSFSPGDQADEADRIVLRFDEAVMRQDQCDAALEHSPFTIEPAPPAGHWRWEQPDQLVYLLESKLPAGREYVVRATDDIAALLGRRVVGETRFTFRTQPLAWMDARVTSSDGEHVNVELTFNQPVRAEDLERHARAVNNQNQQKLAMQVMTRGVSKKMTVRVVRPAQGRVEIYLAGELTGDGGTLAMGGNESRIIEIDRPLKLRNASVESSWRGGSHHVNLQFTRGLSPELPADPVVVTPAVPGLRISHDEHGQQLTLRGDFTSGRRYTATVSANVLGDNGQPLGSPQSLSFEIPDRSPMLRLTESRGILSPHGNLTLDMQACNVNAFKLSATKLYANNLVPHLRGEDADATSRQVVERPIKLSGVKNQTQDVAVDLRQLLDKNAAGPGVYQIVARAERPHWTSDSSVVTISDLAITAKSQKGGHHVLVTSLATAAPVEGVKLAAITQSNQVIGEAVTDEQGIAVLRSPPAHPDGEVWVITAQLGDDLNFIQPQRRLWVMDDVDQAGRAYPQTYDVMLYTERGVYRPGDVVHLTAVIRDAGGAVPPALPLTLRVKRPDGRVVLERAMAADTTGQGVVHADFASHADGQLGRYEFAVTLPGSSKALGSTSALIEAFVPIRIEVKAAPTKQRYGPGEQPAVDVSARYLFGQPAAELPMLITPALTAIDHESQRLKGYSFVTGQPPRRLELESVRESLDGQGQSRTSFAVPEHEAARLWRAGITATVTEPGGRSVSQTSSVIIDTLNRHMGMRIATGPVLRTATATRVDWGMVDGNDNALKPGRCRMRLERIEHDWVLQQVDGQAVWKSVDRVILVKDEAISGNGPEASHSFTIRCQEPGNHRLTIREEGTQAVSQLRFYVQSRDDQYGSPPVASPERVELVLDRKSYVPGQSAKVTVRSPFAGTLMLSVETDRVVQQHVLPMGENTAVVDVPIDVTLRGGAFLSATVIRPLEKTNEKWLPHRAMGMARLVTDHADRVASLAITAPAAAEPGERITVVVQTSPRESEGDETQHGPAVAHVWAVDDGILLTTAFKTPDPHGYFYAQRASAVRTSDLFADLLPDHQRPAGMTRIGAGDDEEEGQRRSTVPMKQREAAVVWRTAQPVGADGRLAVEMVMPRITGRMRIMAVVVDGDHHASRQHEVTLASPLLVEANWPRFAAPGDSFSVPVKLFNSTTAPLEAKLALTVEGPMEVVAGGDDADTFPELLVAPGQSRTIWLKAKATGLGPVRVMVRASAMSADLGRQVTGESEGLLAVRPITPLHVESQLVRVKAGEPVELKRADSFEPGTTKTALSISGQPLVELRPALEQLLDYPHGCLEQTTSRLMAILHAPQLLAMESSDDVRIAFANEAIAAGIDRLWSMQTRGGGLSYWPGERQPTLWGTAYASLFLTQAMRAGHKVDAQFIDQLTRYLSESLDQPGGEERMDDNLRARLCHVLAAWNHAPHGWIARLTERAGDLSIEGRAHLAAAWSEVGRNDNAMKVLGNETLGLPVKTSAATEFLTSPTRQDAMLLSVLLDIERKHEWIGQLVRRIESRRVQGHWDTTLDNASALAALARYQLTQPRDASFTGRVLVADQERLAFDHQATAQIKLSENDVPLRVETQGRGEAFITMTTQGLLKAEAIVPYERGLRLERRWLMRDGRAVDPARLKVGDLVRVEIELSAPALNYGESVPNIAIVDALPGGMEVENPRLVTSAGDGGGDEGQARADRVEFLDDRVILFAGAVREKRVYRYLLRVTTVGRFALPPVQASCMYDAAYAAMGPRGEVVVSE